MAWVTPKVNYAVNYVPTPTDFNRIEGDLTYLKEENKTINGTNSFTGAVSLGGNVTQSAGVTSLLATTINGTTGTLLSAGANLDITTILGRATIYGDTDRAVFAHVDYATSTGYGVRHTSGGTLHLNGSGGSEGVKIRQADADIATFTNTAIALKKDTAIDGALTATGSLTIGDTSASYLQLSPEANGEVLALYNDSSDLSAILRSYAISGVQLDLKDGGLSVAGDITATGALTCAGITSTGAILPTTTPTSGSWTGNTTIPVGIYMVALVYGDTTSSIFFDGTPIHTVSSASALTGGAILSDGTNVTLTTGGTSYCKYIKL